jgi:hypothetical protein
VIMDEMDLVGKLKEVPPLRPEAYERARATLRTAMGESVRVPAPARKKRFSWARNVRMSVAGKVGTGLVGAAAVAVAVVSVTSPAPDTGTPEQAAPPTTVAVSKLELLANDVKASTGTLSGDASLVIRTQTAPDGNPYVTYNLYTDGGEVYVTDTREDLPGAIARHDNLAEPTDASIVAAARAAATGDIGEARDRMVNAIPNSLGVGLSPEEARRVWDEAQVEWLETLRQKGVENPQPRPRPTGKAMQDLIDNRIWTYCFLALERGAANPEVRAGVLRLISSIPDVTVADSNTAGQPSLTITAGPALFGGDGEHVLTVNAETGLPISSVFEQEEGPSSTETYESTRVTLADVAAGGF